MDLNEAYLGNVIGHFYLEEMEIRNPILKKFKIMSEMCKWFGLSPRIGSLEFRSGILSYFYDLKINLPEPSEKTGGINKFRMRYQVEKYGFCKNSLDGQDYIKKGFFWVKDRDRIVRRFLDPQKIFN